MLKHLFPIVTTALLTACFQASPPRENPLVAAEADTIASWLLRWGKETSNTKKMDACSNFWARAAATEIPDDGVEICDNLTSQLASVMTQAGYGSIEKTDVLLPSIWTAYKQARVISEVNRPSQSDEDRAEGERAMRALGLIED